MRHGLLLRPYYHAGASLRRAPWAGRCRRARKRCRARLRRDINRRMAMSPLATPARCALALLVICTSSMACGGGGGSERPGGGVATATDGGEGAGRDAFAADAATSAPPSGDA